MDGTDQLRAELVRAAQSLGAPADVEPIIERPRDPSFGDWATNLAMVLAKPLGLKPRDLAAAIVERLDHMRAGIRSAEIAGPGFINFRVASDVFAEGLRALINAGDAYGRSNAGQQCPVNIEFVSANPTGPLHVGHGRQAALGDAISSLLAATGWKVTREFYYNDAGAQIMNLAFSVQARVRQLGGQDIPFPENGYLGDYIRDLAQRYIDEHSSDPNADDLDAVRRFAVRELRKEQDRDMQAFGVKFDVYFLESSLYAEGRVTATIERLVAAGHTYEKDGALWLKTTDFGDDKDRVMRRSAEKGGEPTYFLPDVAYHVTKWERGFARAINVQGADHHSTVTRVRVGLQALDMGIPPGYPEYVLHQMVTVIRGGEEVKISKRAGSYVTVRDLIDEVGRDAVRYFFLMRKGDSQLVFDVDVARSQSDENPVYYIQMAHARMSGIFRVGEIDAESVTGVDADLSVLTLPEEQELIKALLDYPSLVAGAAEALEPHRVATYLHDTAGKAHLWYHKAHVLGEPDQIMRARLVLARASKLVLKNGLAVLGITAPERM
ncbi:MAG TPA: arginine--tRNA ligase [Gemmatimonadaceae bacterium]|nr:arginine--tRNA ligase [Gemmatimonadaceae bacterium]